MACGCVRIPTSSSFTMTFERVESPTQVPSLEGTFFSRRSAEKGRFWGRNGHVNNVAIRVNMFLWSAGRTCFRNSVLHFKADKPTRANAPQ